MADVLQEYESLAAAYSKRTIQLLQSPHSRVYLALFRALFSDASQSLPADDVHSQTDRYLTDLWDAGYRDVPTEGDGDQARPRLGKDVCRHLITHYRWLESTITPSGQTEYRLTSEAIETMELIDRLGSSSPTLGASRMRTLIDEISRTSVLFSQDYEAGLAVLRARLEEAREQLFEYQKNGGSEELSEEQALDAVNNILELMRRLPVDLRRLEEEVHARGTELVEAFREDDRPVGLLIGEYVERGNRLLGDTEHGRSFLDTLRVMGDASTSADIDDKLEVIVGAQALETSHWEQNSKLRDAWGQIMAGINHVNEEQLRSSRIINRTVTSRDVVRNRELNCALHELEKSVFRWASTVGRMEEGPFSSATGEWSAPSLRTRLQAPRAYEPPPKLLQEDPEEALSLEELRRLGGPQRALILDAIAHEITPDAMVCKLVDAFNHLPGELRRPVEVAGFAQLACDLGMNPEQQGKEPYLCVDMDGKESVWMGPGIVVTPRELSRAREVAHGD